MNWDREFRFTDSDFARIRTLVGELTGIAMTESKREMVYSRLVRRVRYLGLDNFADYCTLLQEGDEGELVQFVNALTTNLTAFFREEHHFDYLATTLLPQLQHAKGRRRLRIWSAGCSTGAEPYSIAMVVKETWPDATDWDVKILATDIDSNVLATACKGVYGEEQVQGVGRQRLQRWFKKGRGHNRDLVRVTPALQELVTFQRLNLMQAWPMRGHFDMIFCRNVVIYFDKPTQRVLFERFANLLDTRGYLFVGHSEALYDVSQRFESLGKTIHRKGK